MDERNMDAVTGKVMRPDGSVANCGESYDDYNRVRMINTSLSSVEKGTLYSVARSFSLAAGETAYIVYEVPSDKVILALDRIISVIDEGYAGVDISLQTLEDGITIDSNGTHITPLNADRNSSQSSSIVVHGEDVVVTENTPNDLYSFDARIIADKKGVKDDFIRQGYILKRNSFLAVKFINNISNGSSYVRYKAVWIEKEVR